MVQNLDDVYSIGTFAQIHEAQDLGDRLKLVVMAHRRIKIVGQILEELTPKTTKHGEENIFFTLKSRGFKTKLYIFFCLKNFLSKVKLLS